MLREILVEQLSILILGVHFKNLSVPKDRYGIEDMDQDPNVHADTDYGFNSFIEFTRVAVVIEQEVLVLPEAENEV